LFDLGGFMAKKLTRFTVWETVGDQHGESTSSHPVTTSKMNEIMVSLTEAMKTPDTEKFIKILTGDFVYPNCVYQHNTNNDMSQGEWYQEGYEEYYTRPTLETLFYENNSLMLQIVNKLIETNNNDLYEAFITALKKSDITEEMLFDWSPKMKVQVKHGLNQLLSYGDKLARENEGKGDVIKKLHSSLEDMLTHSENSNHDKKSLSLDFKNLQFKLQFVEKLHSEDSTLSVHRGLKKIIGTIMIGLFTAGIALAVHRIATGNWLFFDKTTSQEKTLEVQKALGLDCNIELNDQENSANKP
jgi:hypothetical protein